MSGTCTVFGDGQQVTDPQTGEVTTEPNVVWFGPCTVRPNDAQATATTAGGVQLLVYDYLIKLPIAAETVLEGLRVTITAYPEDPALVGVTVEIRKVARGSVTSRRLLCREVK